MLQSREVVVTEIYTLLFSGDTPSYFLCLCSFYIHYLFSKDILKINHGVTDFIHEKSMMAMMRQYHEAMPFHNDSSFSLDKKISSQLLILMLLE